MNYWLIIFFCPRYNWNNFFVSSSMKNICLPINWPTSCWFRGGNFVLTFCWCGLTFSLYLNLLLRILSRSRLYLKLEICIEWIVNKLFGLNFILGFQPVILLPIYGNIHDSNKNLEDSKYFIRYNNNNGNFYGNNNSDEEKKR